MVKKAVIMKGDGIGPEVVDSMINILNECNLQSELIHCDAGSEPVSYTHLTLPTKA